MQRIPLTRIVFEKEQYPKVIPTTFTELTVQTQQVVENEPLPSIDKFFDYYNQLFFEIPATGQTNSHQYLVNQSSQYIGNQTQNPEVEALLQEIASLREQNLELNKLILQTQSGSNATVL